MVYNKILEKFIMKTQIAISLFVSMTLCGNLLVQNTQGGYNVQGNIALQS